MTGRSQGASMEWPLPPAGDRPSQRECSRVQRYGGTADTMDERLIVGGTMVLRDLY
jgi:hypothetical protein